MTPFHFVIQRPQKTLRSVCALMLRDVSATHGASGGYLWAIVEPVAGIILMTIAFSFALREPPLGASFALFYATGMLPFTAFREMSVKVAKSLDQNRPLLAYPSVVFTDAILARFFLTFATQAVIWCVVLLGIVYVVSPSSTMSLERVALGFVLVNALGLGIGIFNAMVFRRLPVWERVWNILNRPLFLISTVFYLYGDLPKFAQDAMWFNPLIHVVGWVREGFYGTYEAGYASLLFVASIPMIAAVAGLYLLIHSDQN